MKANIFLSFFIIFFIPVSFAQRANIWHFGFKAGLDFNQSPVSADTSGNLVSIEGSSSICDSSGNLLFYTNGEKVWNRNHQVMPNGSGLKGFESSVQSSVIIPQPGQPYIYYIFTNGADNTNYYTFQHSVVDMRLNGGLGDLVTSKKNTGLLSNGSEALSATLHCNGKDVWIVTHTTRPPLKIYAFLLCDDGLKKPVINNFDLIYISPVTNLKFSPDGKRLILGSGEHNVQIYDFDKSSGVLSLYKTINTHTDFKEWTYSSSFSGDNSKIYLSNWEQTVFAPGTSCNVVQYDISNADINSSRILIREVDFSKGSSTTYGYIGGMQLGPDNRIYISRWDQRPGVKIHPESAWSVDSLDVINNPDNAGVSCNYIGNVIWLKGRPNAIGMPAFLESYFNKSTVTPFILRSDFKADTVCLNTPTTFTNLSKSSCSLTAFEWYFSKGNSGYKGFSNIKDPVFVFNDTGLYKVLLKAYSGCASDTISKFIYIKPYYIKKFKSDTALCAGATLTLDATFSKADYLWQDGSTLPAFKVSQPGKYKVEVTRMGCIGLDSIQVIHKPVPIINLGTNKEICSGKTVLLEAGFNNAKYEWQDGNTNPVYSARKSGLYIVSLNLNGCYFKDSVSVKVNPSPFISLGNDTTICEGNILKLNADYSGAVYKWQNGSSGNDFTVSSPGLYKVSVTSGGCTSEDSISVSYEPFPVINLGDNSKICQGDTFLLNAYYEGADYLWHDGSVNSTYPATTTGLYFVRVMLSTCAFQDSVFVVVKQRPALEVNDITICTGNTYIVQAPAICEAVTWQDNSTSGQYEIARAGEYSFICKADNCLYNEMVNVHYEDCIIIPNTFSPNGDGLNDIFVISGIENERWKLRIYNRWGNIVYRSDNYQNNWDGEGLAVGVYYYVVSNERSDKLFNSWLVIIR